MSEQDKRIVEINGIKIEVDLRTAKRVDTFHIGDRVKVLHKSYGDNFSCHHGVIVAFDEFVERPAIVVCYIDGEYQPELKFATITRDTKDFEITACHDDVLIDKAEVIERIDRRINEKEAEIEDLKRKKAYFIAKFGALFQIGEAEDATMGRE